MQDGQEFLLGRDADELSARVIGLFADPTAITQIGEAGRRYVANHHDWSMLTDQLEAIYCSLQSPPLPPINLAKESIR